MSRLLPFGCALAFALAPSSRASTESARAARRVKAEPSSLEAGRTPAGSERQTEPRRAPFRIVGYVQPSTAASVPIGELTNLFYAFAVPKADGSVTLPGSSKVLHDLVRRAHRAHVAVSLSVGGWMNGDDRVFHRLAATPESRERFARELSALVERFDLDGIDVDWEFPEAEAAAQYTALMVTLAQHLGPDALLTAAVGAHESSTGGVTRDVLPHLAFICIMAYDDDGEHHSTFAHAERALALFRDKGAPAHKLVLGLPLYSRPHFLPYWEIIERDAGNAERDELRGETYNGRPTIVAKTRLALREAGGVMAWELSQDAPGEYSLVRAIASTVRAAD